MSDSVLLRVSFSLARSLISSQVILLVVDVVVDVVDVVDLVVTVVDEAVDVVSSSYNAASRSRWSSEKKAMLQPAYESRGFSYTE